MNNATCRPCHVGINEDNFGIFFRDDPDPLIRGLASWERADQIAQVFNRMHREGWAAACEYMAAAGEQAHDVLEVIAADDCAGGK